VIHLSVRDLGSVRRQAPYQQAQLDIRLSLLSLRFEVALMHIPYTVEFINRKLTNHIDF